ncbi:hypothetical protein PV11_05953 [Exophiala sideris]|uniref:Uncharacterized protein n=1 Tax=Exophiala sideris TaxID=1016849 RepID=A0A0D1ZB55_9EURO|nr:hypothetical protein PV11_05953 [Exophiala sideris]
MAPPAAGTQSQLVAFSHISGRQSHMQHMVFSSLMFGPRPYGGVQRRMLVRDFCGYGQKPSPAHCEALGTFGCKDEAPQAYQIFTYELKKTVGMHTTALVFDNPCLLIYLSVGTQNASPRSGDDTTMTLETMVEGRSDIEVAAAEADFSSDFGKEIVVNVDSDFGW